MFRKEKWIFTGSSGTEYLFFIRAKKQVLPQAPGVVMLAYTHPRGHMAGWQVNPLFMDHARDMSLILESGAGPDSESLALWNSCFVLAEPDAAAREACLSDLENVPFLIVPE